VYYLFASVGTVSYLNESGNRVAGLAPHNRGVPAVDEPIEVNIGAEVCDIYVLTRQAPHLDGVTAIGEAVGIGIADEEA
jgi:hypothetical protein